MLAALPRVELMAMDDVGHLPSLEEPADFGRIARDFETRTGVAAQGH